ncbi:hypothetical protein [Micrococcus luteus]|uniref:hypothetical protein n=1 Tax=Micrococcus luteus TaxID=1270 RepID=UPI002304B50A|nr:hypothetical protein [Micrococcus luteus]
MSTPTPTDDQLQGYEDGWNSGHRTGYDAARALAGPRQQAAEAITAAWHRAHHDPTSRAALATLADAPGPLHAALCELAAVVEQDEHARMAAPYDDED